MKGFRKLGLVLAFVAMFGCASGPTTIPDGKVDCTKLNNFVDWGTVFISAALVASPAFGHYSLAAQAAAVAAQGSLDLLKQGCATAESGLTVVEAEGLMQKVMAEIVKINAAMDASKSA